MNSTRTLKSIIVALLLSLGFAIFYINSLDIRDKESLCVDFDQYKPSTLRTGLVGEMVSIYRENQMKAINIDKRKGNINISYDETRSITFDLDTIQKFIYHIKQGVQANSKNAQDEKLGLRIYYAAYPDKDKWNTPNYEDLKGFLGNTTTMQYEKKMTLVMLPIRVNSRNEVVDFNPLDSDTYDTGLTKYEAPLVEDGMGGLTPGIDNSPAAKVKIMAISATNEDNSFARNHGGLYPPKVSTGLGF